MGFWVVATGDVAPSTGKLGDMYFDTATARTYMWIGGGWTLAAPVDRRTGQPQHLKPGQFETELERKVREFAEADRNTAIGKSLLAGALTEAATKYLKGRMGLRFTGSSSFIYEQNARGDYFSFHLSRDTYSPQRAVPYRIPASALLHQLTLTANEDERVAQDITASSTVEYVAILLTALAMDQPGSVTGLIDEWYVAWQENGDAWARERQARDEEARAIYAQALQELEQSRRR